MEKYSRYYGVIVFLVIVVLALVCGYKYIVSPNKTELTSVTESLEQKKNELSRKQTEKSRVEKRIKATQNKVAAMTLKKVYAPLEYDIGNDTLFFTLYNDVIEMVHSNSIKIKSMEYVYNPEGDPFVTNGGGAYFTFQVNMELVSNYINLGKFIQDLYQYPYYLKINHLKVKPYQKDKKILITDVSINLYSKTAPVDEN